MSIAAELLAARRRRLRSRCNAGHVEFPNSWNWNGTVEQNAIVVSALIESRAFFFLDVATELDQHGVEYAGRYEHGLLPLIFSWVVPIALFYGLWIFARSNSTKSGTGWAARRSSVMS